MISHWLLTSTGSYSRLLVAVLLRGVLPLLFNTNKVSSTDLKKLFTVRQKWIKKKAHTVTVSESHTPKTFLIEKFNSFHTSSVMTSHSHRLLGCWTCAEIKHNESHPQFRYAMPCWVHMKFKSAVLSVYSDGRQWLKKVISSVIIR